MDLLAGHPLAMRVILPRLEGQTAGQMGLALRSNLDALGPGGDELQDKLFATLRFAEESVPAGLRPLLIPLGLHERFLHVPLLKTMARQVDASWTPDRIDQFVAILSTAGLLRDRGQAIYEIHPALTGFLRSTPRTSDASVRDPWCRAFALVMGSVAIELRGSPSHEKRGLFLVHSANFHQALNEAVRLGIVEIAIGLVESMSVYAQYAWDFRAYREFVAETRGVPTSKRG